MLIKHHSGYDPTKLFQRKVNKRSLPDYYEVIKEPMALSMIKTKVAQKEYKDFSEFVRDFALVPHNAQVYNRQDSQAYVDALEVKRVLEEELKKLVDDKMITEEAATLPYLGEIPEQDPLLLEEEEEERIMPLRIDAITVRLRKKMTKKKTRMRTKKKMMMANGRRGAVLGQQQQSPSVRAV